MGRILRLVAGAVVAVVGLVWLLQGLDVIGGSGMSGQGVWAVIGTVLLIAGLALVVRTLRAPAVRQDV